MYLDYYSIYSSGTATQEEYYETREGAEKSN